LQFVTKFERQRAMLSNGRVDERAAGATACGKLRNAFRNLSMSRLPGALHSAILLCLASSAFGAASIKTDQNVESGFHFTLKSGAGLIFENGSQLSGGYLYRDLNTMATDAVNAELSGKTASSTTQNLFSTRDNTTPVYVRSTTWFGYPVDLTSESVWSTGVTTTATLISPRHVVMAHHATLSIGNTVRFVGNDGTVQNRTLSNKTQIGTTDIDIGILNSDLPASITPAKVLSAAQEAQLVGAPILFIDQNQSAFTGDVLGVASLTGSTLTTYAAQSADSTRSTFWKTYVSGDSSHPAYAILDGEAVLLGVAYTAGNTWGGLGQYYASINAAMTSLGGGYQLTQFKGSVLRAGTSGPDVNVNGGVINVPTASATVRGALAASDWSAFSNKLGAAANTGTGVGVWRDNSGTTARFKSIKSGSHTTVTDDGAGNITIDAAASSGTALNFTDLGDAPHSYSGAASKLIEVNSTADGLAVSSKQVFFRGDLSSASGDFAAIPTVSLALGTMIQFVDTDAGLDLVTFRLVNDDLGTQFSSQPDDGITPADYNATTNPKWWERISWVEVDGGNHGIGTIHIPQGGKTLGIRAEDITFYGVFLAGTDPAATGGSGAIVARNQTNPPSLIGVHGFQALFWDSVGRLTWKDEETGNTHLVSMKRMVSPTYSTSMTVDAFTGSRFVITATNSTAFTINAPTNLATSQTVTFTIKNTSGGSLGTATWNAVFKMASWTQPANGFSRSITFDYNGTNLVETSRTPTDVPN
jgi:hypothetical protein